MLTDLLSTVSDEGEILLEEEDYLLARVRFEGREMLAEISRGYSGGIPPDDWPDTDGILLPDSEIKPGDDSGARILLFSMPELSQLYLERMKDEGPLSEYDAVKVGKRMLPILRKLHDAGYRIGYLGPENVLFTPAGNHFILGGARGIPDTPFSPPEAVGKSADDPRSDIYALGLLMFRIIAGSDDREVQIEAWNLLSEGMMKLLEKMVSPEADSRFANLTVLSENLKLTRPKHSFSHASDGAGHHSGKERRKGIPGYYYVIAVMAVIAAVVLIFFRPGNDGNGTGPPLPDSTAAEDSSIVETVEPDSLPSDNGSGGNIQSGAFQPVIWVSNGSGQPGLASEFRQGPASGYSSVYTCTGSLRGNSILLARRRDPGTSLQAQTELYSIAQSLALQDTSLQIYPVDITILLGRDLTDDQVRSGILTSPVEPAGTLYVDIANHGVQGTYAGAGAATWMRSVINGRSIILQGQEWYLSVVDFRDGDRLNDELGIPDVLDETRFLYRADIPLLTGAEVQLREAVLENTLNGTIEQYGPSPPDIWILLGR